MRLLVTGASGAGTTTLARALAAALDCVVLDADDYFWLPSEPPFQHRRPRAERVPAIEAALARAGHAVVAGSVMDWDRALEDSFALIAFVSATTTTRLARIHARDLALYGRVDPAFVAWAAAYDDGTLEGRSRAKHDAWLAARHAPVVRIDGELAVDANVARVRAELAMMR